MDILRLSRAAQAYYDGLKAPSLVQGWEKYIATDGEHCLFVHSDYTPMEGEAVFFVCTRNKHTSVQLYKPRNNGE